MLLSDKSLTKPISANRNFRVKIIIKNKKIKPEIPRNRQTAMNKHPYLDTKVRGMYLYHDETEGLNR